MELEYADEIYIFVSEDMKGLKFIDRSPSEAEQKFAGQLPDGVFHSDMHSMSQVEWDKDVNEPNGTKLIHYRDGSNNARTYMVSAEKFQEILETIMMAQKDGKGEFIIDTRDRQIEAIQERETKGEGIEGQAASSVVVTPKDIAEADTENRIASSEIYEANKHLYTHKEYENYIDN